MGGADRWLEDEAVSLRIELQRLAGGVGLLARERLRALDGPDPTRDLRTRLLRDQVDADAELVLERARRLLVTRETTGAARDLAGSGPVLVRRLFDLVTLCTEEVRPAAPDRLRAVLSVVARRLAAVRSALAGGRTDTEVRSIPSHDLRDRRLLHLSESLVRQVERLRADGAPDLARSRRRVSLGARPRPPSRPPARRARPA